VWPSFLSCVCPISFTLVLSPNFALLSLPICSQPPLQAGTAAGTLLGNLHGAGATAAAKTGPQLKTDLMAAAPFTPLLGGALPGNMDDPSGPLSGVL
jgi:hypothetical protein